MEDRTVTCEELEATEEIKLGYGVAAGKNYKQETINLRFPIVNVMYLSVLFAMQVKSFL